MKRNLKSENRNATSIIHMPYLKLNCGITSIFMPIECAEMSRKFRIIEILGLLAL